MLEEDFEENNSDTSYTENDTELTLDDLFDNSDDYVEEETEEVEEESKPTTKAVSERINEVRRKTETETREKVAKDLGYDSYDDMMSHTEKSALREAGYDDNDPELNDAIEKILQKRLQNDPRFKKLEEIEQREKNDFVNSQIKEINALTGSNYTSVDQFSKDTLSMWEKTGNLKQAYLATEGENLLNKRKASSGSLAHLSSPGKATHTKVRALTEEEKDIYRSVLPDITDEELAKKTIEIKD